MAEILLRPNLRAIYLGMTLPAALAVAGLVVALGPWSAALWVRGIGWAMAAVGGLLLVLLLLQSRQPRLAYEARQLLVYLRSGAPIRLPIENVQCAFLGSGTTRISAPSRREIRTSNLIIRLEEKATEWADVEVKPALGKWAEGYITIHGAWCEPLTFEVVEHLNIRLHDLTQPAAATAPEQNPS